jgi:hypothetical protein
VVENLGEECGRVKNVNCCGGKKAALHGGCVGRKEGDAFGENGIKCLRKWWRLERRYEG